MRAGAGFLGRGQRRRGTGAPRDQLDRVQSVARHHALRPASSSAAVVITASSRLPAVHTRLRAGFACAASRHRCSVPGVPGVTPISRATTSTAALSGGSTRATARSLNACPYRATSLLHRRPQGS